MFGFAAGIVVFLYLGVFLITPSENEYETFMKLFAMQLHNLRTAFILASGAFMLCGFVSLFIGLTGQIKNQKYLGCSLIILGAINGAVLTLIEHLFI